MNYREQLFNYLNDAQFLYQGPLDTIQIKTKELTGIDLTQTLPFEAAKDNDKTLVKIGRYLIGYHQHNDEPLEFTGSIHKLKLSQLCNVNNRIWSEDDALPPDREKVHQAYERITKVKLSLNDCLEQEDGTYYLFNVKDNQQLIVFLSYPGNNYIYQIGG